MMGAAGSKKKELYEISLNPFKLVSNSGGTISNSSNPIGNNENNTSYTQLALATGSGAYSQMTYSFDTSAIPADAEIVSVSCKAKAYISSTTASRIATRTMQLMAGLPMVEKGTAVNLTTTATAWDMDCGEWTREELSDCKIQLAAKRGSSSTTSSYYIRFYGATLTIKYLA